MTVTLNKDVSHQIDLTMTRTFDAPRELVFRMWTDPDHALNWMGPREYPAVVYEQEVRVGGKWRGCLQSAENPEEKKWQGGEFLEIDPPEKLVFTFAWDGEDETVVTVILTETDDGKTRMVFHQTPFETEASRDGHEEGWGGSFDRLGEALAVESSTS